MAHPLPAQSTDGLFATIRSTATRAVRWFAGLSIWYQLFIGTALGSLGGSTFVGLINKYAVYAYTYNYGARVPVEGVPYLGLAVSVVSFTFLLISLTSATLIYALLFALSKALRIASLALLERLRRLLEKLRSSDERGQRLFEILRQILMLTSSTLAGVTTSFGSLRSLDLFDLEIESRVLPAAAIALAVLLTILSIWPWLVKWFAVGLTAALIIVICVALFQPPFYAGFLRTIRYGGGSAITITCHDEASCRAPTSSTYLFLITSDVHIVYDADLSTFVEIPNRQVARIEYTAQPRSALPIEIR